MNDPAQCDCPICKPQMWDRNCMTEVYTGGYPLSQTGFRAERPRDLALAEILVRLDRLEAILKAHIRPEQP